MVTDPRAQEFRHNRLVAAGALALAPLVAVFASYVIGITLTESPDAGMHRYGSIAWMCRFAVTHSIAAVVVFLLAMPLFENKDGRDTLGALFKYVALANTILILSGTLVVACRDIDDLPISLTWGLIVFLQVEGVILVFGTIVGCFLNTYLRTRRLLNRETLKNNCHVAYGRQRHDRSNFTG